VAQKYVLRIVKTSFLEQKMCAIAYFY